MQPSPNSKPPVNPPPDMARPPEAFPSSVSAGDLAIKEEDVAPTQPVRRLRRGSTFQNRPMSTPVGGISPGFGGATFSPPAPGSVPRLRRGSSFVKPSGLPSESPPIPRLRRGASFLQPKDSAGEAGSAAMTPVSLGGPGPASVPRLRRGSSFAVKSGTYGDIAQLPPLNSSFRESPNGRTHSSLNGADGAAGASFRRRSFRQSTPSLPRADTFGAFGTPPKAPAASHSQTSASSSQMRRASSADKLGRASRTCGMCGSCGGGMPVWAPERFKKLSAEDQETVLVEMRTKEEMGKLDSEMRRERVEEIAAVGRRLDKRRARAELVSEDGSATVSEETRTVADASAVDGEPLRDLESVDLVDDVGRAGRSSMRKRKSRGSVRGHVGTGDDIRGPVGAANGGIGGGRVAGRQGDSVDDCGFCESLEVKVRNLEEQLDVLKEVVQWCSDQEEVTQKEIEDEFVQKRSQTWMDKIASAYYGNTASAGERSRLREEVDILRKATDFMFKKLQASGQ